MITIYFADWAVPQSSVTSGTPVVINLKGLNSAKVIHGYVHHSKPDIAPNKHYTELVVIGASYVLKQQSQKVWVNSTADQVISQIAKDNGFSYIAVPHPRVYEQISQAGMSDWELMVKLAKQSGYSLRVDNTTIVFQPLTQEFTDYRQQASYYSMGTLQGKSTGIYEFKPLIGEAIPFSEGKKSAVSIGGVDKKLYTSHVNTKQTSLKTTRKKYITPSFDSYSTSVVAPSFEISKYEAEAAQEMRRYAYRAKVVIPGNPKLTPDSPIFLDNVGDVYSGYWTVLSVENYIKKEVYVTTVTVGTDSLGLSTTWTDNKNIASPDAVVKRVITPGIRQKNILPKTTLKSDKVSVRKNATSPYSSTKNLNKMPPTTAPSYKWVGTSGNLKKATFIDKKMGEAVVEKMVNYYGK